MGGRARERAEPGGEPSRPAGGVAEPDRALLRLIVARAILLLVGLNVAQPIGLLPERLGTLQFMPLFNVLAVASTLMYLAAWRYAPFPGFQVRFQISVDLALVTYLVFLTGGIDSPFVSFYLIATTCGSLMLGRSGGLAVAAFSTIFYAAIVFMAQIGIVDRRGHLQDVMPVAFQVALHAMGFFTVALLGAYLSSRLHAVETELQTKIGSLARLESLNRHVVRSIRSGLVTVDLEGRVTLFNSTAAELTGRESKSVIGTPLRDVFGERLWCTIRSAEFFHNLKPARHEEWVKAADGQQRFIGFSVSPLMDEADSLIGHVVAFQDLSEIKRLERELRRQDRMAAIGRMAAGIAHEIRNPLTAMRGSVEILRAHASLPPTDQRLLEILLRESDRLNRFVDDFLKFARPGKHKLQSLDLVPLIGDSVTLLRNSAEVREKHRIVLDADVPEARVIGDDGQLQQVFWNLSQNALRAMPCGGTLAIRVRASEGGLCRVVFEDQGVGMTEQELQDLFQPFSSGFPGGTGLGLSIVFQIVEDHGGSIDFDSRKGEGTRVTVSFPLNSALAPTPELVSP